ncbi:MAG: DUF72 domain-containing protein [Candidatus Eremiobacteraeota bacterium]|nr:DUF72 domain-containing protein [Candidatus Eremiobacteraeota bacterium]
MIRVGTSGWVYGDWRNRFYPKGVAQRSWLTYYAQHFDTVELNATTYRLPKEEQVARWCESVPQGFLFTVKLSRLITHRKTLAPRVDEFIFNYMNRVRCFRTEQLAQILCQFPPYLERDDERLQQFLAKLPAAFRYVVEFRNKTWLVPTTYAILKEHNAAFCIHDYPGMRVPDVVTSSDLAYVRLHGYLMLYAGSYPKLTLKRWRNRILKLADQARDVFIYFNNDTRAAAIKNAQTLRTMLAS